jgi:hypothetical protein
MAGLLSVLVAGSALAAVLKLAAPVNTPPPTGHCILVAGTTTNCLLYVGTTDSTAINYVQ